MKLIDVDSYLDEQFGRLRTRERKAYRKQAKAELKIDLRYCARRGEKVTLKDMFSFK
ncbi:MAG: hypothetical protein IKY64_03890 [Bacteroidaceae bacterium]|nr:hypothetical protein [Bacteroidaceae bacterium]